MAALPHGLKTLDLSRCHGGARGCAALAASLRQHPQLSATLTTFRMGSSDIGARASQPWAEWLSSASALTELDLSHTGCSAAAIAPALCRGAPGLRLLELRLANPNSNSNPNLNPNSNPNPNPNP